uniref:Uncharacterized protein n=1 Tax=Arundo donax TaxID=35708 RepID=A0A0A9C7H9_ARUDO
MPILPASTSFRACELRAMGLACPLFKN